jgi:hypothetical protein
VSFIRYVPGNCFQIFYQAFPSYYCRRNETVDLAASKLASSAEVNVGAKLPGGCRPTPSFTTVHDEEGPVPYRPRLLPLSKFVVPPAGICSIREDSSSPEMSGTTIFIFPLMRFCENDANLAPN